MSRSLLWGIWLMDSSKRYLLGNIFAKERDNMVRGNFRFLVPGGWQKD